MDCVSPFIKAGEAYRCGRCLPCKFRQRRVWYNRLLLEGSQHDYSSAVTLTYDQAALPGDGQLHPGHLRNWLKRYRKRALERYPWRHLRFFACGEYGAKQGRPHYHVVLFGQPGCENGRTGKQWCGDCSCVNCSDVSSTWGLGSCSMEVLNARTCAYVSGYVSRKFLSRGPVMRVSPFLRMSNQPGIGARAMWDVASEMLRYGCESKGIPYALRGEGGRKMILGRYLRSKLGEYTATDVSQMDASAAVQAVFEYAWNNSLNPREVFRQINEDQASRLAQAEALKPEGGLS